MDKPVKGQADGFRQVIRGGQGGLVALKGGPTKKLLAGVLRAAFTLPVWAGPGSGRAVG